MQFIVAAVLGGLLQIAGSLVGRVLLALGIGFVTYSGFDVGVTWLLNQIKANMAGLPAEVLQLMGFMWVDKAIGLIFAAYAAALGIKMLGGSTITRMVHK